MTKLLKFKEVAERLACSIPNVYKLRECGALICVATGAHGKGLRVEEAELERFIAARREFKEPERPAIKMPKVDLSRHFRRPSSRPKT